MFLYYVCMYLRTPYVKSGELSTYINIFSLYVSNGPQCVRLEGGSV